MSEDNIRKLKDWWMYLIGVGIGFYLGITLGVNLK